MQLTRFRRHVSSLALAVVALALPSAGCIIIDDTSDAPSVIEPPPADVPSDVPMTVGIDTSAPALEAPAGQGVGVFVEYAAGGHWRIWTTSDVDYSGASRWFDILASVVDGSSTITNVAGEGLESADELYADDTSVELVANTSTATDGVTFDAPPGAMVEVALTLDGVADSRIVYWVSGGVIHTGAPTNPVDFQPSSP